MAANKSQALIVFTYIERQHKRTKSACGYLGKVDFTILLRAKRVVSLCSSLCFTCVYQPSEHYKIVVCNTQNEEDISSRKEAA